MRQVCDCEQSGHFYTGVPGILAEMQEGRVAPGAIVERCDQCERFPSDVAALAELRHQGLVDWELVDGGARSFTVHCYAVVRISFRGIVARDAKDAAAQALDRFDWDQHGTRAEFANELTELLVDVDGDRPCERSLRFSPSLEVIAP